jgi:UDP-N-acetylmuramoyl-L-alanyl-D-glutamate--2,6-diaminopimelate ligase
MWESAPQAGSLSLRRLLADAGFDGAQFIGAADILVKACTHDSRRCLPGDLFVALVGSRRDGHDYAREATARGASSVLVERFLPLEGRPMCIVGDTREAYGRICQALAGQPSRKLKTIGVTGTSGKTTVSCLIASVLQAAGLRVGLSGTLGACDGDKIKGTKTTTPHADVLARWMSDCLSAGCTHAVLETSSVALAQKRVAGIELDAVCLTNVRREHLDRHGSLGNYRKIKGRIFGQLAAEGFVVLNADDPTSVGFLAELQHPTLTVGLKTHGEIRAAAVERFPSEQTFLLTIGADTAPVRTSIIGDHHLYNCMLAAAIGAGYGIGLSTIVRGLEAVERVPGRMERIECGQPFGVFVDSAHTPDGLATTLRTLRQVTDGKLICVFAAGRDRDRPKRPLLGRAVECGADVGILTRDDAHHEYAEVAADVLRGCDRPKQVHLVSQRAEAIGWALAQAMPGDCVLLAGKGHEKYVVSDGQPPIDDRQLAQSWLYQYAPTNVAAAKAA